MMTREEICTKIETLFPELGECWIELGVEWDETKRAWVVDLMGDGRDLVTYLENEDAEACIMGEQCVALGVQIAQLKSRGASS
ncbi:MAG: hypothetical protein C4576_13960 [Desulfobacteraceae bacterium]|nr:MAG: hypothetical protein C4576_13960 [Desulfobacteraceae bacterium]